MGAVWPAGLTAAFVCADVVPVRLKLISAVLLVAALAAFFVWVGGPGPYFGVGLAVAAWRYFLWEGRD